MGKQRLRESPALFQISARNRDRSEIQLTKTGNLWSQASNGHHADTIFTTIAVLGGGDNELHVGKT